MQIEQVIGDLAAAHDADGVGVVVGRLGRDVFGLTQCGVTWREAPSDAWWVEDGALFERLIATVQQRQAPIAHVTSDGVHALLLPVFEPSLLGAVCCGHSAPYSTELLFDLTTLATHVSLRMVQLGARAASDLLLEQLTPRQVDVALLAARGPTNAGIAATLGLSENTVKKHLKDVFEALGVGNRTELAVRLNASASSAQALRLCSGDR